MNALSSLIKTRTKQVANSKAINHISPFHQYLIEFRAFIFRTDSFAALAFILCAQRQPKAIPVRIVFDKLLYGLQHLVFLKWNSGHSIYELRMCRNVHIYNMNVSSH